MGEVITAIKITYFKVTNPTLVMPHINLLKKNF